MTISAGEPLWLSIEDILAIQREQIDLRGGLSGIREHGLIASAVARVQHLYHYEEERDVIALAVRLGVGIAQNHSFVDGNKRTGAFALVEFLAINGVWLEMPNDTRFGRIFEQTVTNQRTEQELIAFLLPYVQRLS